jgi:anthranilate synthase component 1
VETQKKIIENFEDLIIDSEYKLIIEQALAHIEKGDLYEINLSRPSLIELSSEISMCELAHIFEAKAKEPYSACLPLDAKRMILSNSPECFLRKSGNKVSTFPIKGTRRRYEDSNKDNASIEELMRSPKEMAEHLMVVDLERNDLGKVAQAGSVTVESFAELNTFSNVHHLISEVSCELKDNINPFDLLRATFPSGSVTGAPKIRVMQIIRSLEKYSRSAYTGALGYIDGKGDLEFSILIRSLMVNGNQALLNTGGGIVYDSNPDFEIEETHLKAQSILNLFE